MNEIPFLCFTTHDDPEYRAIGVRARYLDEAVMCLVERPELVGYHVRRAVEVGEEEMRAVRHVFSAPSGLAGSGFLE